MTIYVIIKSVYHDDVPWHWIEEITNIGYLKEEDAKNYCDKRNIHLTEEDIFKEWDNMSEEERKSWEEYYDDPYSNPNGVSAKDCYFQDRWIDSCEQSEYGYREIDVD